MDQGLDAHQLRFDQASPFQKVMRRAAASRPGAWLLSHTLHHVDKPVYLATKGRQTAAGLLSGLPVLLLTTRGAGSGLTRTVPLLGLPTEEGLAVIASNYGRRAHPGWYYNLLAHPDATVTVRGTAHQVRASLVSDARRERIWQYGLRIYPGWAAYAERADRELGIFLLTPRT